MKYLIIFKKKITGRDCDILNEFGLTYQIYNPSYEIVITL
jgi:hypothetical protein